MRPKLSDQLDYEGEIVLVIGKQASEVSREKALDVVAGLTLCNEGSVRDWLRHAKFNVTQGKNFDRSGSIGPWIVPADEIDLTQAAASHDPRQRRGQAGRHDRRISSSIFPNSSATSQAS